MKVSNILKHIILIVLLSLSLYPAEEVKTKKFKLKKLKVATIDLDNHFKINKPLRKETVRIINRYHYLKQKYTITVDRTKKRLFGTNELNMEEGLTVASNLNVRIAILIDSEKILITNEIETNKQTNTFSNNPKFYLKSDNYKNINNAISNSVLTNGNFTNDILTNNFLTNEIITNDTSLTNGLTSTNETKNLEDLIAESINENNENNENMNNMQEVRYEYEYNFNVVDIENNNILKEYKSISSNEASYAVQRISEYLETYFAKMVFDSFEEIENDIDLNFVIERISSDNRTNAINNRGDITEGDSINIKFNPNKDGYLYIFGLQNNGNMILMYPNDFNNFLNNDNVQKDEIEAGENYIIPPENSVFRIVASPLEAGSEDLEVVDSFYAIYTKRKQGWITAQYFSGDGFKSCSKNKTAEFVFKLKNKLKLKSEIQISKIYLNVVSKTKGR